MTHDARTDHAASLERARAHLCFVQHRRHMLAAMRVWMTHAPGGAIAQDEADATCSAVRQIVADQGVDRIARNSVSSPCSVIAETQKLLQNQNARHVGSVTGDELKPTGMGAEPDDGQVTSPVLKQSPRAGQAGGMP